MKTLSHNYIYIVSPFGLELRDIDIFQAPPNLNGKIRFGHRLLGYLYIIALAGGDVGIYNTL